MEVNVNGTHMISLCLEANVKDVKMFLCRYSLEYAPPDKSAFHALFSDKAKKANITDPGVCHGDELM